MTGGAFTGSNLPRGDEASAKDCIGRLAQTEPLGYLIYLRLGWQLQFRQAGS